jgi:hypothetical protein
MHTEKRHDLARPEEPGTRSEPKKLTRRRTQTETSPTTKKNEKKIQNMVDNYSEHAII